MQQNIKIVVTISIAFVAAFLILIVALHDVEPQLVSLDFQKKFYFQDFDPKIKKIFLIGSSEVHRLNATYIENYILQHADNYKVYNIALHSDLPQRRIASLDYIIASEPSLVVYGTGFREYHIPRPIEKIDTLPKSDLPSPPKFFNIISEVEKIIPYDFTKIQSPKLHLLRFIRDSLELRTPEVTEDMLKTNTPFMKYKKEFFSISTDKELELFYQQPGREWPGIKDPIKDKGVYSLNEIISKLKEKNIKIVLFSNPSTKYELETVGNHDIEIFEHALANTAHKNFINVHFLHEKYTDLPIFQTGNHITMNKTGLIFSEDIANIILNEIES